MATEYPGLPNTPEARQQIVVHQIWQLLSQIDGCALSFQKYEAL